MRHVATALRSLARQPGMSLMIVLTLALGIGASTALFAYLIAMLRPRVDGPDPERVVWLYMGVPEEPRTALSYPELLDLPKHQTAVRDLVAYTRFGASVGDREATTFAWAQAVSGGYFPFFATRPALGRLLQPADDRPGAERVAVLGHFFWQGTLGGDPKVVGRQIRINGLDFRVVGVVEEGFQGAGLVSAVYVSITRSDEVTGTQRLADPESHWLQTLGRLSPGTTLAQAQAGMEIAARALDETFPLLQGAKRRPALALATRYDDGYGPNLLLTAARVLLAAAVLFLLLGCANVANLLLARAVERQREWGIRAALGAGRMRLLGGVMAESLLLCTAGGILGVAFAAVLVGRIEAYAMTAPAGLGNWGEGNELIRLDAPAFAFVLLITSACALLCGLAPVLQGVRRDLLAVLKSESGGTAAPAGALTLRKALVIAQVALSMLLLLGGSLLVRTLRNAQQVDPGFDTDDLVAVTFHLPRSTAPGEDAHAVYQRVLDATGAVPGVAAASLAHMPPLAGWSRATQVTSGAGSDKPVEVGYNLVAPGFFATTRVPVLLGRALDDRDRREAPGAVVVSRALARRIWGDVNPVGRMLTVADPPKPGEPGPVFEVVGVAADVHLSPVEAPKPFLYFSSLQRRHSRMTLLVRTAASPATLIPPLRQALRTAHPDLSVVELATFREQMERILYPLRMHAEMAGLFGLLGLGVAVIGLFGLLRYTVSLRVREIGIRMAVGARSQDILGLILRQGLGLTAVGVGVGLLGALGLTRVLASLLFGIGATDPVTFVSVPVVLVLVALSACWLPARRAARLDPLTALRE